MRGASIPHFLGAASGLFAGGAAYLFFGRRWGSAASIERVRGEVKASEERLVELNQSKKDLQQQLRSAGRRTQKAEADAVQLRALAFLRGDAARVCELGQNEFAGTMQNQHKRIATEVQQGGLLKAHVEQAKQDHARIVAAVQKHLTVVNKAEAEAGGSSRRVDLIREDGHVLSFVCDGIGGRHPSVRVQLDGRVLPPERVAFDDQACVLRMGKDRVQLVPEAVKSIPLLASLLSAGRVNHGIQAS
eukprot:Hpha_TRINITY_DN15120_c1_g1::TRINITY_DN15120_c1_g1_i1::g.127688::m.127688